MSLVYPVIHHLDAATTLIEAQIAHDCGADGVFLISHHGEDIDLLELGNVIHGRLPRFFVGINLLATHCLEAFDMAREFGLDGVWADRVGVSSRGADEVGLVLGARLKNSRLGNASATAPLQVFGSVAFKYQSVEPAPALAAQKAFALGMIPTTSGAGTGLAPSMDKIIAMSEAVNGTLAVASGMSCENVAEFAPYLSHILVATKVSRDA